jgi:predicted Fe-S protein YdhL (DUF1289 family)
MGCFRTIEEITNWTKYTNTEKLKVINQLNGRNCVRN